MYAPSESKKSHEEKGYSIDNSWKRTGKGSTENLWKRTGSTENPYNIENPQKKTGSTENPWVA